MKSLAWVAAVLVVMIAVGAIALLGIFGGRDPVITKPDLFQDVTATSGVDFTYRNGSDAKQFTILESLGGGVGLIDYDRDGKLDIFLPGGGHFEKDNTIVGLPNRLFRNEGDWHFRDVTAEVGLPTEGSFYSHGCAVGDYDNDGWPDLLVTGYGKMVLHRNRAGQFEDVTVKAGLVDKRDVHWSTSAAWTDVTGDGYPDLFVGHYVDWSFANHPHCKAKVETEPRDVCPPEKFKPLLPGFYINQGDGTFREAGEAADMRAGPALGVVAFDADNDNKVDLYVANDAQANFLYLNRGEGKFEEAGGIRGVALNAQGKPDGSMGVAVADYNRTGLPSIFITNYQGQDHALLRNLGRGFFEHAEHQAGLGLLGRSLVGFGTGFFDYDLDGNEDLFFANGHVLQFPGPQSSFKQKPVLLRNQFDQGSPTRFAIATESGGPYFRAEHMGRGAALGDLDNDGKVDLVISHSNEPVVLLRNLAGEQHHWLGIALKAARGRDVGGAKLVLEVKGQKLTRFVVGGGSYLSANDRRVVFGLGKETSFDRLTVHWPSAKSQTWENLAIDTYHELDEDNS